MLAVACSDGDEFTTSPSAKLTFSVEALSLDTVFSTVPSPAKSFWVYNHSGSGIRCQTVRLERGNQTGFRVNVDGVYLGPATGYQTNEVQLYKGDSIRVYVELTSRQANQKEPLQLNDNLVFTLESGVQQILPLSVWTWDAKQMRARRITEDTILEADEPIVIYDSLVVEPQATLTIKAGTQLFFHDKATLDVHGALVAEGTPDNNVVMRGDRLDHMFDYLPYDGVSGQWGGVRLHKSDKTTILNYTDIHSTFDGIVVDSTDVNHVALQLDGVVVHNCQGDGVAIHKGVVAMQNTIISNALGDCLNVMGGKIVLNHCTIAQFYPFDARRGAALRFSNSKGDVLVECYNSLLTGYADDVLMGSIEDEENAFNYVFDHSVIRTPEDESSENGVFDAILFEDVKDNEHFGKEHFKLVDIDEQRYNFDLTAESAAIGVANPETTLPTDRLGRERVNLSAGAYEYVPQPTEQETTETENNENNENRD